MNVRTAAVLVLLSTACVAPEAPAARRGPVAPPVSASAAPARPTAPVEIVATEIPSADRWRVKYTFKEPVAGIAFERSANKLRAPAWTAYADGKPASWSTVNGLEALVAEGAPVREIELLFPTDVDTKPADYELNAAFSDGGRLLYTGHFSFRVLVCPNGPSCATAELAPTKVPTDGDVRWTFRTLAERGIVALDGQARGELAWTPTGRLLSQGTYVYFGGLEPIETPHAKIIVDPGMPAWMRSTAEDAAPELLAWYESETGAQLARKPFLILSFGGTDQRGRTSSGGGLPGLMQLGAWGKDWLKDDDATRIHWKKSLAHELFHLWNGDLFSRKRDDEGWLSEGSADFMAYRALLAVGEIDEQRYRTAVVDAANKCLLGLRYGALLGKRLPGQAEYSCGMTLFTWADAATRTRGSSATRVLGAVFADAKARGDNQYGTEDVLDAVTHAAGDATTSSTMEGILRKGLPTDADTLFATKLRAMGWQVDLVPLAESTADKGSIVSAIGVVMARCDCDKRISFNSENHMIHFLDVPECNVLRDVRVDEIEGKPLAGSPGAAYDALVARKNPRQITFRAVGAPKPTRLGCRNDAEPPSFRRLLR